MKCLTLKPWNLSQMGVMCSSKHGTQDLAGYKILFSAKHCPKNLTFIAMSTLLNPHTSPMRYCPLLNRCTDQDSEVK